MILETISTNDIKKIFGNKHHKLCYLTQLFQASNQNHQIPSSLSDIDDLIIRTWSYEISKNIIRDMFRNHPKFQRQQDLSNEIDAALADWISLDLGAFEWPFSAQSFDQHVHMLNRRTDCSEIEKDSILMQEIVKFRRIKQLNALRNDFIENIIFENPNVIPTLGNRRGVDFYINGEPYDQKVGKSVGKAFIQEYGENYRNIALSHPELLAKSLYENQDEERFGDEARLLIVYLDNNVSANTIRNQLLSIDFSDPYEICFDYKHSNNIIATHRTKCFVVLLHN